MKYRVKGTRKMVNATQYKNDNFMEFNNFLNIELTNYRYIPFEEITKDLPSITLSGLKINENDYVIKDSEGYHVISKDDFESTYELVEE